MSKKVRVAIVGLGFGAEFIEIFQQHPPAAEGQLLQKQAVHQSAGVFEQRETSRENLGVIEHQ